MLQEFAQSEAVQRCLFNDPAFVRFSEVVVGSWEKGLTDKQSK